MTLTKDYTGAETGHLIGLFPSGAKDKDGRNLWAVKCRRCGRVTLMAETVLRLNRQDTDCGCSKVNRLKAEIEGIRNQWAEYENIVAAFYAGRGLNINHQQPPEDLKDSLLEAIRAAASGVAPYTLSGIRYGLYGRRHELPTAFHTISRNNIQSMAKDLIDSGAIVKAAAPGSNAKKWLDVPGGPIAKGAK